MSEMIERVARAIDSFAYDTSFDPEGRAKAYKQARAAIDAMREPTEKMEGAGYMKALGRILVAASAKTIRLGLMVFGEP